MIEDDARETRDGARPESPRDPRPPTHDLRTAAAIPDLPPEPAPPMTPNSHRIFTRAAVVLLAVIAVVHLIEPLVSIGDPISRNYNEGWNALHVQRLLDGEALYPPDDALFVNNYPPFSFVVVAAVSFVTGDPIVAGRVVSLVSMLVVAFALGSIVRTISKCRGIGALAAVYCVFLFVVLFPHYVAMNDPQMLGHALQWVGLAVLLRSKHSPVWGAAALLIAGGLVKHNLVSVPLAAVIWIAWHRRDQLLGFVSKLAAFVAIGCAWLVIGWGGDVFTSVLGHARTFDVSRLRMVIRDWFGPMVLFLVVAARVLRGDVPQRRTDLLWWVVLFGFGSGVVFSLGGGISYNVVFDGAIALAGLAALGVDSWIPGPIDTRARDAKRGLLIAAVASGVVLLGPYTLDRAVDRLAERNERLAVHDADLAFVEQHPGPMLAGTLALVHAAGRDFEVDLFNVHEAIAAGAMDPARLATRIKTQEFAVLQLSAYDRAHRLDDRMMDVVDAYYEVARTSPVHGNFYLPRR